MKSFTQGSPNNSRDSLLDYMASLSCIGSGLVTQLILLGVQRVGEIERGSNGLSFRQSGLATQLIPMGVQPAEETHPYGNMHCLEAADSF